MAPASTPPPQHSQSVYPMLTVDARPQGGDAVDPGRREGPADQAIRDDDPVIFFEHKALYASKGEVPDGEYLIPFGHARHVRAGERRHHRRLRPAWSASPRRRPTSSRRRASAATCIDLRTTSPLDEETILDSVETDRPPGRRRREPAALQPRADIAALVARKAFASLKAPPAMVTAAAHARSRSRGSWRAPTCRRPTRSRRRCARRSPGVEGGSAMAKLRAFTMPKWGIEMTEGTVAEWMVAEGDAFHQGRPPLADRDRQDHQRGRGGIRRPLVPHPGRAGRDPAGRRAAGGVRRRRRRERRRDRRLRRQLQAGRHSSFGSADGETRRAAAARRRAARTERDDVPDGLPISPAARDRRESRGRRCRRDQPARAAAGGSPIRTSIRPPPAAAAGSAARTAADAATDALRLAAGPRIAAMHGIDLGA